MPEDKLSCRAGEPVKMFNLYNSSGEAVGSVVGEEIARRLVACWNACENPPPQDPVDYQAMAETLLVACMAARAALTVALSRLDQAIDQAEGDGLSPP